VAFIQREVQGSSKTQAANVPAGVRG